MTLPQPQAGRLGRAAATRADDAVNGVGTTVKRFYEEWSFPGYDDVDTVEMLLEKARAGGYVARLDEEVPKGASVLDAGCGTGQLAILLSLSGRAVTGVDFSFNSLRKGNGFKSRFGLGHVWFAQMDLFNLALKDESFDYVFCNGVLHHTADAYRGFQNLCRLVRPDGYIIVGLYNTYGRVMLKFRQLLFTTTGRQVGFLDSRLRAPSISEEKKRIWYMDQYRNPHEEVFTVDDVLGWFALNGIEYVNALPRIRGRSEAANGGSLFEREDPGCWIGRTMRQVGWIFTRGREGGFFVMIGRRLT